MEQSVVPLVPLNLDKPRHLRLDIAALCQAERDLSDFWGKKTSVYACLLEVPISVNDLSIIVLHGLRHEDPTLLLPEVKGMLNHSTIPVVFSGGHGCMDKGHSSSRTGGGRGCLCGPFVHVIDWGQLWAYARVDLGLRDVEFWRLTLYELDLLSLWHRHRQEREDRRACVSAWLLANINRDTKTKSEPFSLDEVVSWLGYASQYVKRQPEAEPTPATVDDLRGRLDIVHMLHKGLYGENGQAEEGA